jgi:hypothetical protein
MEVTIPTKRRRFGLMREENLTSSSMVNVYLRVCFRANTKQGPNFFEQLRRASDIGPNRDRFEIARCGTGIVCCPNINNWLPCTSVIPAAYRATPIS